MLVFREAAGWEAEKRLIRLLAALGKRAGEFGGLCSRGKGGGLCE